MFSGSEWGRVGEQCVKWVLISLGQQALMGVFDAHRGFHWITGTKMYSSV